VKARFAEEEMFWGGHRPSTNRIISPTTQLSLWGGFHFTTPCFVAIFTDWPKWEITLPVSFSPVSGRENGGILAGGSSLLTGQDTQDNF